MLFHGSFFLIPFIKQLRKFLKTLIDELLPLAEGDVEFVSLILDSKNSNAISLKPAL